MTTEKDTKDITTKHTDVDLGFAEKCESWELQSPLFPSKIGGPPAWLDLCQLPKPEDIQCPKCTKQRIFLCQIYAPIEEHPRNFHRTLFVFVCKTASCSIRNNSDNILVLRSTLPRENNYYSSDPPDYDDEFEFHIKPYNIDEGSRMCPCGTTASLACSKCLMINYCCKDHQVIHWKDQHKKTCGELMSFLDFKLSLLYPEFELIIDQPEKDAVDKANKVDEAAELKLFEEMKLDGEIGTLSEIPEEELQSACIKEDKEFTRFKKNVADDPDQVIRYSRGGDPLWIAAEPKLTESPPKCEYCSEERQFEFQIMPQMLSVVKENDIDWGVILVYTCRNSCAETSSPNYKKEFVFKQDVTLDVE